MPKSLPLKNALFVGCKK